MSSTPYKDNSTSNKNDNDNEMNNNNNINDYDQSERSTIYDRNENDHFDDEPESEFDNKNNEHNIINEQEQALPPRKSKNKSTKDKDSKNKTSKSKKSKKNDRNKKNRRSNRDTDNNNNGEQQSKFKHTTANLPSSSKCKKILLLLLMFLILILIMFALQKLMEHFFFGKKSDNTDINELFVRDLNSSFPLDKNDIDAKCSRGTIEIDEGESCKNACIPVYYDCCDPFNEFILYDTYSTEAPQLTNDTDNKDDDKYPGGLDASDFDGRDNITTPTFTPTNINDTTTSTIRTTSVPTSIVNIQDNYNVTSKPTMSPTLFVSQKPTEIKNITRKHNIRRNVQSSGEIPIPVTVAPIYWNEHKDKWDEIIANKQNQTCTFNNELSGCMRYAKCQAITNKFDPAPASLNDICTIDMIKKDPISCQSICEVASCCYSYGSSNCIASNFDMCIDYAPCQNLRSLEYDDSSSILPIAPRTLDHDCFYEQLPCLDNCKIAECCSNSNSLCYRNNFITCLTYSPCNNITNTHIHVPKQFNNIAPVPNELIEVCNIDKTLIIQTDTSIHPCTDLCNIVSCCWNSDVTNNCFMLDPLGCLAWEAQCQILVEYPNL